MADNGATAASVAQPSRPPFDADDSLMLSEYGLTEFRASPNTVGTSPANMMASLADYDMTFAHAHGFGSSFDGLQPKMEPGFANHRGSVGNMSDADMSGGGSSSAHLNRMSVTGSPGHDGNHTSPESAQAALGMFAMGDTMKDASAPGSNGADQSTTSKRSKDDVQDPPLWSEMKTKAGKERKRLPLACIACRRKKIRCSGEKPACKHCLRSRIPCVYKVTTRKAAPRTDYMAMLDKRLKRMEDRVIKLIPKESLPSVANVGRSVVKPAIPGAPPKTPTTKKRPAEEAFGNELDEWSRARGADPNTAGSTTRSKESDENKLLTEGAESLPSKEIQEHLAEVYFDYVYGQSYPLLHKPSFMRKLAAGKVPPVLILAICAISARFSNHPQLRTEPCFLRGDNWAERAREISLKRYDSPNITILIVYLLLGLHEFGTCQGGRSWMFGGMAQRMAYALQLHKENEYDPLVSESDRQPLSATDKEIRRRTMWSCFLMDRFNSSGSDRPIFVHEQYIEVQLPVKEHLYIHEIHAPTENLEGNVPNPVPPDSGQLSNPRDNMGVSAYTIRLVCTWGKLIKYMNLGGKEREADTMWSPGSTFHAIKQEAKDFKAALPEMLVYSPENLKSHAIGRTANSFLYLHILWQQIMLFMHRFALPSTAGSRPPKDMPHDFLTESARAALDAANQISILINEAMDHNVVAPFAGYSAFFSSTVHVHGVFSKNPKLEAQSKKYLAYNVKYLTKMKKYWGMFHYIAENLKELYRQHADAQLKGPSASGENKGNIFQYGDWFDRYPHGVSKTDYEDAAESSQKEPGTDAVLGHKSDLQSVEEFFASLSPPSKSDYHRKQARRNKTKSISKPDPRMQQHSNRSQQNSAAHMQTQQRMEPTTLFTAEDIQGAMAAGYDSVNLYLQHQQQQQPQSTSQQFLADFTSHQHSSLPLLNTSPSLIHPSHNTHHQLDPSSSTLSPFPDLATDFHNAYWNLDTLGLGPNNTNFFDPMSSYFVPFNVEPPAQHSLGDEAVFGAQGPEAYGYKTPQKEPQAKPKIPGKTALPEWRSYLNRELMFKTDGDLKTISAYFVDSISDVSDMDTEEKYVRGPFLKSWIDLGSIKEILEMLWPPGERSLHRTSMEGAVRLLESAYSQLDNEQDLFPQDKAYDYVFTQMKELTLGNRLFKTTMQSRLGIGPHNIQKGDYTVNDSSPSFKTAAEPTNQASSSNQNKNGSNTPSVNQKAPVATGAAAGTSTTPAQSSRPSPSPATQTQGNTTAINIPEDFILLCMKVKRFLTARHDLQVSTMTRDRDLFEAFRREYHSKFGWAYRQFSFQTIQKISFVQFALHPRYEVDGIKPDMPPETAAHYTCEPRKPHREPALDNDFLMHRFSSPINCFQDDICLRQFPKRVGERPTPGIDPDFYTGWGMHLEQGLDLQRIFLVLFFGIASAGTFGLVWGVCKSLQDGFSIASFIVGSEAVAVAVVQILLSVGAI
ncbi:hypothetical protein yc1106_07913 [Curvularia clavata]|uniref:Zn(2)-C6 fungal-type domain-containing protein n=1 Tax=Curvularia clavata TaxID=95742 RepID=A0A9Q8ZDH9_CURCL|nr:hypothetical protein yc1106_07913 [Curvularia clavata]